MNALSLTKKIIRVLDREGFIHMGTDITKLENALLYAIYSFLKQENKRD